jgi:hypothetical protein
MTKRESDRLKELFQQRSNDFLMDDDGDFDTSSWEKYLKKIKVRMIEEDELCEAYNNPTHDDMVLVESILPPGYGWASEHWLVVPRELAFRCLVLGQIPPGYSKKPAKNGQKNQ